MPYFPFGSITFRVNEWSSPACGSSEKGPRSQTAHDQQRRRNGVQRPQRHFGGSSSACAGARSVLAARIRAISAFNAAPPLGPLSIVIVGSSLALPARSSHRLPALLLAALALFRCAQLGHPSPEAHRGLAVVSIVWRGDLR